MVKYSRDQSTEAPRRRIWSVMAEPYWRFHSQTRAVKTSRPRGLRLVAFGGELAFDHHLRGDASVIGAGNPERGLAAHSVPAGEDVHLRLVEHVTHVQTARDIGRRQEEREVLFAIPTHVASLHGWGTPVLWLVSARQTAARAPSTRPSVARWRRGRRPWEDCWQRLSVAGLERAIPAADWAGGFGVSLRFMGYVKGSTGG
jgi:hypothetical protein